MSTPPFFHWHSVGRGDLIFWGGEEGPTVVMWESLSEQAKASWGLPLYLEGITVARVSCVLLSQVSDTKGNSKNRSLKRPIFPVGCYSLLSRGFKRRDTALVYLMG